MTGIARRKASGEFAWLKHPSAVLAQFGHFRAPTLAARVAVLFPEILPSFLDPARRKMLRGVDWPPFWAALPPQIPCSLAI